MVTLVILLAVSAFICSILNGMGKCPAWVPLLLISVIELLRSIPIGK